MNTGIYAIKNLVNNKMLVGSSINVNRRLTDHFRHLSKNRHYNKLLQEEYNVYGKSNFTKIIIELCEKESVEEKELHYINLFDSFNGGYNQTLLTKRCISNSLFNPNNHNSNPIPYVIHDLETNEIYHVNSKNELCSLLEINKLKTPKAKIVYTGKYVRYEGTQELKFKKYYLKNLRGKTIKTFPSIYHAAYYLNIPLYEIKMAKNSETIRIQKSYLISTNTKITPYKENRGGTPNPKQFKPIHSIDVNGTITYYKSIAEAALTMPNKSAYRKIQECVHNNYGKLKNSNKYKNLKWYPTNI